MSKGTISPRDGQAKRQPSASTLREAEKAACLECFWPEWAEDVPDVFWPELGERLQDEAAEECHAAARRAEQAAAAECWPDADETIESTETTETVPDLELLVQQSSWESHPYGLGVKKRVLRDVCKAAPGKRREALRQGALTLARYRHHLALDGVFEELVEAAKENGLVAADGEQHVRDTILDGAVYGVSLLPLDPPVRDSDVDAALVERLGYWKYEERSEKFELDVGPGAHVVNFDLGEGKSQAAGRLSKKVQANRGYVLVVVAREQLARAASTVYGVPNYRDLIEAGERTIYGSCVVCLDSLWRVSLDGVFDLVVIEESEQTLRHLYGGTISRRGRHNQGETYAALATHCRATIAKGGRVLALDALASDLTLHGLGGLCGFSESAVRTHVTVHERQRSRKDFVLYEHNEKSDAVASLLRDVDQGKRVAVFCSQKRTAKEVAAILRDRGLRVALHTSESSDEERQALEDVTATWSNVDAVVASPSVDTGISYVAPSEASRFDVTYLIAEQCGVNGPGWTDLVQTCHRIRECRAVHFYARGSHREPLDYASAYVEADERWDHTQRANAAGGGADFAAGPHDEECFQLAAHVTQHRRLVTANRRRAFRQWWIDRGATILRAATATASEANEAKTSLAEIRREQADAAIDRQATIPEAHRLDAKRFEELRTGKGRPADQQERDAYARATVEDLVGPLPTLPPRPPENQEEDEETATARRQVEAILRRHQQGQLVGDISRFAHACLLWEGHLLAATRSDRGAVETGYRHHGDARTTCTAASLVVAAVWLGAEAVDELLRPPRPQGASSIEADTTTLWTEVPSWSQADISVEDEVAWFLRFREAADAVGVGADALTLALPGASASQAKMTKGGLVRFVGVHLRRLGLQTSSTRPQRDDGSRPRVYQLDDAANRALRWHARIACARAFGYQIAPLNRLTYTGDEWEAAVGPNGRWSLSTIKQYRETKVRSNQTYWRVGRLRAFLSPDDFEERTTPRAPPEEVAASAAYV